MSESPYLGIWAGWATKVGKKWSCPTPHFGQYNASDGGWYYGKTNALLVDGHVEEVQWNNHDFETTDLKPPYHKTWTP